MVLRNQLLEETMRKKKDPMMMPNMGPVGPMGGSKAHKTKKMAKKPKKKKSY